MIVYGIKALASNNWVHCHTSLFPDEQDFLLVLDMIVALCRNASVPGLHV